MTTPGAIRVIDSHTEGEPTRVIIDPWGDLRGATMAERRDDMRSRADALRRAIVCEPRGHAAIVGALLTEPVTPGAAAGIIFFNNETYLGMCGHGLIGVTRTLQHLGKLSPGPAIFDTPVGTVRAELGEGGEVTIENVPSFAHALDVSVNVPEHGDVKGDVAYGGNWFFITHFDEMPLTMANAGELTRITRDIAQALRDDGITGTDRAEIDHIELSGPAMNAGADARNFVLCSGGEYDRSPCGTGTSATMAVLHARNELPLNEMWRQESITGGLFTGWLEQGSGGTLIPRIRGRAYITGESTLIFDPDDPFRMGLPAE
jgi:4-hydroxyproline epimerase